MTNSGMESVNPLFAYFLHVCFLSLYVGLYLSRAAGDAAGEGLSNGREQIPHKVQSEEERPQI